ncbi:uncharacterized protein N7496_008566 [Penicillium cataractarum]|uniref:NACHT domain-containing protein n=1 Tax=Penicillium cataractarum TaxID=2100454 RepID=A0A9W9RYP1_9EURO|nr:uncharacterized protein N7496_008566 [Penicillium cataractarum]KAJ5368806.1 hypothetical protein N7496_008566 [Penicillium cataractarum]
MREIEQAKGGLVRESYEWILHHPSFRQLQTENQKRLLWIRGEPGHGKTMLLIGMIKELESSSPQAALVYFFCQGPNAHMNSATAVLRGLIYRLIMEKSSLITHLRERYDRHKGIFQDGSSFIALSDIAARMLRDPGLGRAFIVIDALDECETSQDQLLNFIAENISVSPSIKWIVSSRNVLSIIDQLGQTSSELQIHLDLADNPDELIQAVNAYIDSRIEKLQVLRSSHQLKAQVRDVMREKAANTFLWVALVAKELEKVRKWNVLKVLDNIPSGLEGLYDRMMRHIGDLDMDDPVLCYRVLAAATLAYRPLLLAEMGVLAGLPDEISSDPDNIKEIVTMCGSFFRVQDDSIQFIHQSALDHLKNNASEVLFAPDYGITHFKMFSSSIKTLSKELKRNIYNLETPGTLIEEIKVPEPDPLGAVRYSCVYWVSHLSDWNESGMSLEDTLQDDGQVHGFLKDHLLHWLEASSLIGAIGDTIHAVIKLQTLLEEAIGKSALMDLADDVHRFVLKNGFMIQMAPLQAYVSALLFTPSETPIRRLFAKQEPRWIPKKPIVNEKWGSAIHSLEVNGEPCSLAFSHDSKILASNSYRGVQLWDVSTGLLRAELKTNISKMSSAIHPIVFSHDSRLLASAHPHGHVFIWEVTTGIRNHMIECVAQIELLVFSRDSSLFAVCYDSYSEIWETNTWSLKKEIPHRSRNKMTGSFVCFSPNMKMFVPPPENTEIEIWDTDTCSVHQKFHVSDEISKIVFSPDGKLLASGSEGGTICIWNVTSFSLEKTIRDHTSQITFLKFSHDSQTFVSLYFDGRLRIWNTITWSVISTIDGHSSRRFDPMLRVISVTNDCKLLAFVSGTIQIWDMARSLMEHQVDEPRGEVPCPPIFSEDLKRSSLVWIYGGQLTFVRNTSTGTIEKIIELEDCESRIVGWSHDLSMFAWISECDTVKLGELSSEEAKQVLTHQEGIIKGVTFSFDCKYVAFTSDKRPTITIWSVGTGQLLLSIANEHQEPRFVTFSHDSGYLAATYPSEVKIWDIGNPPGIAPVKETLSRPQELAGALTFSHDSRLLAVAHGHADRPLDFCIRILDTSTMIVRETIMTDIVAESLSFNSDASFIKTGRYCLAVRSNDPDCAHAGGTL